MLRETRRYAATSSAVQSGSTAFTMGRDSKSSQRSSLRREEIRPGGRRKARMRALPVKTLRSPTVRGFLEKHLVRTLDPLPLREVTTARVRRLLADKSAELGPKSLNHLRGFLHLIFEVARQQGGPWEGRANPIADVPRYDVAPRPPKILSPTEYDATLASRRYSRTDPLAQ